MIRNKNFLIIALIVVVDALGYGIIIPILYSYTQRFGLTDFQAGLLFALFSLCQFLATPIIGRLSDKFGRRPLLIGSLAGTALSFMGMAFAPNAIVLFFARALDGITAGNIPVASAVISDSTEQKDRARGFGVIGAAWGFGFVIGPAISAFTIQWGANIPFLISAGLATVATLLTALVLPETNKNIGHISDRKLFDFRKLFESLFDPNVGKTLLISLLISFAFGMFIFAYQPVSVKILQLTPSQISVNFAIFGIVGVISQLIIIPFFTKRVGELQALLVALIGMVITFGAMYFATNQIAFIIISIPMAVANSFVGPLIQTLLSREVDAKSQGTIFGVNASYGSLGTIFGPIVGGVIATVSLRTPFLGGSVVLLICFLIATRIYLNGRKKVSEF